MIQRRGQTQQNLQQSVQVGRSLQVLPARHVGDTLPGIIAHNREMITGGDILAHDNRVPPSFGPRDNLVCHATRVESGIREIVISVSGFGSLNGACHIETQSERLARSLAQLDVAIRQLFVQSWINIRAVRVGPPLREHGSRLRNLFSCGKARIEQRHVLQPPRLCLVPVEVLLLK